MAYSLHTKKTWSQTLDELRNSLALWGVKDWEVEHGGGPDAPRKIGTRVAPPVRDAVATRRVTLRFTPPGRKGEIGEILLVQDRQERAVDNLRVLFLIVDNVRLNEVRGLGQAMRDIYTALPPPSGQPLTEQPTPEVDPYDLLEISRKASPAVVEGAYRAKAREVQKRFPDQSSRAFSDAIAELNRARDSVLQ